MAYTKFFLCISVVVMLIACGDDSSSTDAIEIGASSSSSSGKTISGVAQKGPFLAQSAVKIYELDPKTLAKTGKVFSGEVDSNGDGRFKVPNVELSSPYALLEVNGRFRNEVTGDVSSNEITLRALVNLDGREEVNINLLTHLTYERILYLFETGVDFAKAKKQAESEFLSAFHVNDKFENFEDMNIFGDSEEGGVLLAISVLVLNYYGNAKLAEFLETFAADFKKDGTWDDETTRYNVGSRYNCWADNVLQIRNNVVDWKIGSVPKFGKYILKIRCGIRDWISNCYEVCDVEGAITRKSTNEWNICLYGAWFGAYARIVDTFGWGAGEDGELRKGDSTGAFYKYDEFLNMWNRVEMYDTDLQLGCTLKREGEIGLSPKDNSYYVCKHYVDDEDAFVDGGFWVKAQEIDLIKRDEKCESEDVGRIIPGIDTVTNNYYCSVLGWVDLRTWSLGVPKEFHFNSDINYGSLKDERDGKTYKTVKIGDQVWMAENLNYAVDGIGHCYEDVPENCEVAGRLYKWDVAKTVCPEGWHLPSKAEFDTLLSAVKQGYDEEQCSLASMLKATSGWNYGGQGCDKTGFSAVPAGGKHVDSYRAPEYNFAGSAAFFLTSTEHSADEVYIMQLNLEMYIGESVVYGVSLVHDYELTQLDGWPHYNTKESEFSVRCLKDATSPVVP